MLALYQVWICRPANFWVSSLLVSVVAGPVAAVAVGAILLMKGEVMVLSLGYHETTISRSLHLSSASQQCPYHIFFFNLRIFKHVVLSLLGCDDEVARQREWRSVMEEPAAGRTRNADWKELFGRGCWNRERRKYCCSNDKNPCISRNCWRGPAEKKTYLSSWLTTLRVSPLPYHELFVWA